LFGFPAPLKPGAETIGRKIDRQARTKSLNSFLAGAVIQDRLGRSQPRPPCGLSRVQLQTAAILPRTAADRIAEPRVARQLAFLFQENARVTYFNYI
jgi:hypothetical protein